MSKFRILKETSNTAKTRLRQFSKNAEYNHMEKTEADMTNFRRKPYSVERKNDE